APSQCSTTGVMKECVLVADAVIPPTAQTSFGAAAAICESANVFAPPPGEATGTLDQRTPSQCSTSGLGPAYPQPPPPTLLTPGPTAHASFAAIAATPLSDG